MSKKSRNNGESAPRHTGISTGQTFEQFMSSPNTPPQAGHPQYGYGQPMPPSYMANPNQHPFYQQQHPGFVDPRVAMQPRPGQVGGMAPRSRVEGQGGNPNRNKRAEQERREKRKRTFRTVGGVALTGVIAIAGTYAFSNRDAIFGDGSSEAAIEAEAGYDMAITPLETLGAESLVPGQCDEPEAVLMVATVSGEYPLVPLLATTENPTPTKAAPYLTEDSLKDLPSDQQAKFSKFITEDGYPQATLNELPLALSVCEPNGANAITEKDGELIINRSALAVSFEDPSRVFGRNLIKVVYQEDGATDVQLDPNQGQYVTLPNPSNNLFLATETDEVYNKAVADLAVFMVDPQQVKTILAAMQIDAVEQLDNVVDGHDNISYPDGVESLQQAIDKALVKRLVGDKNVQLSFTGNYTTTMQVPKDPASKAPITEATPIKGLDNSVDFNIKEIKLEFGSLTPPNVTEQAAAPEPTATPAP